MITFRYLYRGSASGAVLGLMMELVAALLTPSEMLSSDLQVLLSCVLGTFGRITSPRTHTHTDHAALLLTNHVSGLSCLFDVCQAVCDLVVVVLCKPPSNESEANVKAIGDVTLEAEENTNHEA